MAIHNEYTDTVIYQICANIYMKKECTCEWDNANEVRLADERTCLSDLIFICFDMSGEQSRSQIKEVCELLVQNLLHTILRIILKSM